MIAPVTMYVTPDTTLAEAVAFTRDLGNRTAKGGFQCPVCGMVHKLKRYKLQAPIARTLCRLYRMVRTLGRAVHISKWVPKSSRGYHQSVLSFHGLIEQVVDDPSKPFNRSGRWTLTSLGEAWITGDPGADVRSYVIVEMGVRTGQSTLRISIESALQEPWNPEGTYDPPRGVL